MTEYDVAIIGGGASGLSLAVLLSRKTKLRIAIFESGARAGKKLASSGNGQGNVSNVEISDENYYGGGKNLAINLIKKYGNIWQSIFHGKFISDERGRIYPSGKQASALTDCLLTEIKRNGVYLYTGAKVDSIKHEKIFKLNIAGGESVKAKYVVLCTGGKAQKQYGTDGSAYALAENLGHKITPLFPSLVQLKTETTHIKTLRGIRAECEVSAIYKGNVIKQSFGDVIFTEYGVSGNAIFSLSAAVADKQGVILSLAFAPEFTQEQIEEDINEKIALGYETSELLALTLNNQIGRAIIRRCNCKNAAIIADTVKHFTLPVCGTLGFDYAQVTKGGIDFCDIKENLESKKIKNLFFGGEILDVDGDCGGYNLTWAFASAAQIANEIAERQNDKDN